MIQTCTAVFRLLGFLLLTIPLMPMQLVLQKLNLAHAKTLPHFYHRLLCKIIAIRVSVQGAVPRHGLVVSNHVSWTDIVVLSATCPLTFIAKREVSHWPFFGWLANLQGCEFVNRESRQSTRPSTDRIRKRLLQGETLVLFPEGTSGNGRKLLPFKSAYFGAVENSDIAITLATIIYEARQGLPLTQRQWANVSWTGGQSLLPSLWHLLRHTPLSVKVIFQPLPKTGHRKAMARAAEQAIRANLHAGSKIG